MDFSRFDTVFCDSVYALRVVREAGLPSQTRILSTAPAVLQNYSQAEDIERRVSKQVVNQFIAAVGPFCASVYNELRDIPALNDVAIAAAYIAFYQHRLLHKALMLEEADLLRPRLLLQPRTGQKQLDRVVASAWSELLQINPELVVHRVDVPAPVFGTSFGGRPPSIWTRLNNLRSDRLLYRFLLRISRYQPTLPGKQDILILKDSNELVRDAAMAFAFRGHRIVALELPDSNRAPLSDGERLQVEGAVRRSFQKTFGGLYPDRLEAWLINGIADAACAEVGAARGAADMWRRQLSSYTKAGGSRKGIVLHGAPHAAPAAGLQVATRQLGIPVFGFQHGVRREIAAWPLDVKVLNENNFTDRLLCYGEAGARYSMEGNPFASGPAEAVGMPQDYRIKKVRRKGETGTPPLFYVSTLLYRGGRQISNTALSDNERALREAGIVRQVLAKLPHRVRYKPYPSLRYVDEDPVHAAVKQSPHIEFLNTEGDMRYMLRKHRVLITGGATSTVGWCALSGLPLVFIDDAEAQPLSGEARDLFSKAFFVFDPAQPDFHSSLTEFLSQPIESIEAQAERKQRAYGEEVRTYLGLNGKPSGLAARHAIEMHIQLEDSKRGKQ